MSLCFVEHGTSVAVGVSLLQPEGDAGFLQIFGEAVFFGELPLYPRHWRLLLLFVRLEALRDLLLPVCQPLRNVILFVPVRLVALWGHLFPLRNVKNSPLRNVELFLPIRLESLW